MQAHSREVDVELSLSGIQDQVGCDKTHRKQSMCLHDGREYQFFLYYADLNQGFKMHLKYVKLIKTM